MGRALIIKALCYLESVDRLYPVKVFGHQPGFIGLQRTDKMPYRIGATLFEAGYFVYRFLHIVFTEAALSGGIGSLYVFGRFGFADGQQVNMVSRAARLFGGSLHTGVNVLKMLCDSTHMNKFS